MTSEIPSFGRLVKSYEDFLACAKDLAHFAFKRPWKYFHHILLKTKEKIVEYCVNLKNMFTGGEVQEAEFSEESIMKAIENKELFFINAPNYPKTDDEKAKAQKRCAERIGKKKYSVACNNCEHLVTFILTGCPISRQIKNAEAWKMVIVDTLDVCVCRASRNVIKTFISPFGCSPIWIYGARCLTTGASLLFTGALEGFMACEDLKCLKDMRDKNHINQKDYEREVFKTKSEAIGATVGSVLGACVGAAFSPVGSIAGSYLGNVAGRVIGSVFSGQFFDSWFGK